MSDRPQKLSLYLRGLHALDRVARPPPNRYVCPICLEAFWAGELTGEHAPPASIGGRVVCLTCTSCNSEGGRLVDSAVAAERRFRGFLRSPSETYDAKLTAQSTQINVEVSRFKSGYSIVIPGERNDPIRVAELKGRVLGMREMKLTHGENFTRRQADVGFLRAAYLLTFAKLGYRFVISPALETVREQIRNPAARILPVCRTYIHDPACQGQYFMVLRQPVECLGVVIDDSIAFLPYGEGDSDSIQRWLMERRSRGGAIPIVGRGPFSWPQWSEFDLDYHEGPQWNPAPGTTP